MYITSFNVIMNVCVQEYKCPQCFHQQLLQDCTQNMNADVNEHVYEYLTEKIKLFSSTWNQNLATMSKHSIHQTRW